ncbi:hypothetical protein [Kingella oralis]|uniref:hypothetical protein n=1 Tax=Kingella oralis TaxID=505 RepID=UPI0012DF1F54|nr:hypothetical protein [Kingella oralis]QMT41875.1 hypothetical protein H3L93_07400 [Kingella oralis]
MAGCRRAADVSFSGCLWARLIGSLKSYPPFYCQAMPYCSPRFLATSRRRSISFQAA